MSCHVIVTSRISTEEALAEILGIIVRFDDPVLVALAMLFELFVYKFIRRQLCGHKNQRNPGILSNAFGSVSEIRLRSGASRNSFRFHSL